MREAEDAAVRGFAAVFGLEPREVTVAELALEEPATGDAR